MNELALPAGLTVLRQQLDTDECRELQAELVTYAHSHPPFRWDGEIMSSRSSRLGEVIIGPVTRRLIGQLNVPYKSVFAVNLQPPFAAQNFHRDGVPAIVLHPQGSGAFDYAPDAMNAKDAEKNHLSIDVEPGDIVISSLPYLWHRGRSRDTKARYNAVFLSAGR